MQEAVKRSRSGSRMAPQPCPHCRKAFQCRSLLQRHVSAVHLKEKPFSCAECHKSFGTKYALDIHVRVRHRDERPHRCHLCAYRCHLPADLRKHLDSHARGRRVGCPREDRVAAWLEEAGLPFERTVRVDFCDGEKPELARLDFVLYFAWGACVLDEHQHELRCPQRERRRMERVRSHHLEPVKFVRYNPDAAAGPEERRRRLLESLEAPPRDGFEVTYLFYEPA